MQAFGDLSGTSWGSASSTRRRFSLQFDLIVINGGSNERPAAMAAPMRAAKPLRVIIAPPWDRPPGRSLYLASIP